MYFTGENPPVNPYRLPRTVLPKEYFITLTPDLEAHTFSGATDIILDVKSPISEIVLHALDLDIYEYGLTHGGRDILITEMSLDRKKEMVTFKLSEAIFADKPGTSTILYLKFKGELNDKMHGFYRMHDKEKNVIGAATQFEATDARRCFPCFDEPDMKAIFHVSLYVPEKLTALSNMPIKYNLLSKNGLKKVDFKPTPLMSTYLLAFVVAELEYIEDRDRKGIPIRVYAVPGKKEWGRFGLEVALHALPFYADYYKVDYPLPKLDFVALPDFAAGAMENWGLETFRETALLINPEEMSAAAMERVADVVDHELAHHWFGNRTTMAWWTHLWLNEGFATFAEMLAVADKFPKWNRRVRFVAEDVLGATHDMDKKNSHAIEQDVKNPAEIRELFDATTYSGGSAVCNMIEQYLGPNGFAKGVSKYLERHKYANAETNDLWRELGDTNDKPVEAIMSSYTRQPGYPVLFVDENPKWSAGQTKVQLKLEQSRFIFDGSTDNQFWNIPLGYITANDKNPNFKYMEESKIIINLDVSFESWIKFNPGHNSLYRVAYTRRMWKLLADAVRAGELPEADRLGLLDDAFALSRAGYMKTSDALNLLSAYKNEDSFYVWAVISNKVGAINGLLHGHDSRFRATKLGRDLFYPIAIKMGWDKPDHQEENPEILLRALAIRNLGQYGVPAVIWKAQRLFNEYLNGEVLDPDMRQTVFALVCENGDGKTFDQVVHVYDRTDDHQEKIRVLRAMGSFTIPDVIQKVLAFSLSEKVRAQDTPILLSNVGANDDGRKPTWNFIKENWEELERRYHGGGFGSVTRVLQGTTSGFTTTEDLADVEQFFSEHPTPGAERAMAQSLEMIRSNISWLARDLENIREWLEQRV